MSEFKIGQRAEFTLDAYKAGLVNAYRGKTVTRGRVVAVRILSVRVLRDGYKTPDWYHEAFWRPITRKARRAAHPDGGSRNE